MKDKVRFRPSTVLSTRRWPVPVVRRYGGTLPPVTVTSACDHLARCSVGDSLRPAPLGFSLSSLFIPLPSRPYGLPSRHSMLGRQELLSAQSLGLCRPP